MDTLEKIKSTIVSRLCPVHDIHPFVEIAGGEIKITCCCELFRAKCLQEVRNINYRIELERSLET